ncbi:MAG: phosphoribosylformylglycinamidine synthase subunit PurL [Thermoguttaceae bacterium]
MNIVVVLVFSLHSYLMNPLTMLWEVEIRPAHSQPDTLGQEIVVDAVDLNLADSFVIQTAHGYLVQGELSESQIRQIADELLADSVVEQVTLLPVFGNGGSNVDCSETANQTANQKGNQSKNQDEARIVYVLPKPGVTDSVAESAKKAIADFGIATEAVRTFKKYWISGLDQQSIERLCSKLLANSAIEQVVIGDLPFNQLGVGSSYRFALQMIAIRGMDDSGLMELSKKGQLYLSLAEMQTIRNFFVNEGRDPSDIELETIAQTWSEHCSHKTLAGRIEYHGPDGVRRFENMLKETIFAATVEIREHWKKAKKQDLCVSVFSDNAGVVRFDDQYNVCFKVETHNHPSALEPYGGANTGLGGVIRDPMGTGMGAKPICSTDVFCFAPPEISNEDLPSGVLHPRRIMRGVVAGVRDYGNRMGIPTVNGAVYFDKRYLGNPLVFCGNVGILPQNMSFKQAQPGDLIVAIGGRTGRDGIHGATFSSAELTSESETLSGGAVQIGNAITEKMVLDVMLTARDRGLYNAVTDCGAGGFSSAVGEMGEDIGAEVELDAIPLKYEGLSYTEMWISEAQERMVFAVPKEKWEEFDTLCASEDVEATVIGVFRPTNRLVLNYKGTKVGDLTMSFLHKGRPPIVRQAVYTPVVQKELQLDGPKTEDLFAILSSLNVASKHWIIRQYDHEVQAGSVVKPLLGAENDGPSDAAVVRPRLGSNRGIAISCGMNPHYGDYDPYNMAASAIDEAIRNGVAVGADPSTMTILDNFCWGNTERPETLGSLVRAAIACYDVATGLETPFISGKDSLNNEYRPEGASEPISIPASLLISAMGQIADVSQCTTMDFKKAGNLIFKIGETKNEMGGSHWSLIRGLSEQRLGVAPTVDVAVAKKTFQTLHSAITSRIVRSVHDLSEGGLATAIAESCFAGNLGAKISLGPGNHLFPGLSKEGKNTVLLFSESNTRFLCEVEPEFAVEFSYHFEQAGIYCVQIGEVVAKPELEIFGVDGHLVLSASIAELKQAWLKPLDW